MPRKISYPAKPRITNNPRISFGPRKGSGIFRHSLTVLVIEKLENFHQERCAHECNRANIRYSLSPPSVFARTTIHARTYHSDPNQLLGAMSNQKKLPILELTRTSRIGTGCSSRLLSRLTQMFIAEKKN